MDSPDHKSHIAYATGAKTFDVGPTGTCPSTHPVVIPQVMYEVRWAVSVLFGCVVEDRVDRRDR